MKLLVAGGRNNYINKKGFEILDDLHSKHGFTELVNGMASGIDSSAREWAKANKIPIKEFPAQWDKLDAPGAIIKVNKFGRQYNANAGFDRNFDMLKYTWEDCDGLIVVFPGGPGSYQMLKISLDIDANVLDLMDRKELVYA